MMIGEYPALSEEDIKAIAAEMQKSTPGPKVNPESFAVDYLVS